MPSDNLISATVSAEDLQAIKEAIALIKSKLPFLVTLNPQSRMELVKMGEKSIGFDEKCTMYMANHGELIPSFVDQEELMRDRALRSQMLELDALVNTLGQSLDDTLLLVNQDIWMANLAFYQSVREAAKRGRPNAQTLYDDLRTRFPGGGGRPTTASPTVAPAA